MSFRRVNRSKKVSPPRSNFSLINAEYKGLLARFLVSSFDQRHRVPYETSAHPNRLGPTALPLIRMRKLQLWTLVQGHSKASCYVRQELMTR